MMNNEKFIKKWEKQRELGKGKYIRISRIRNISAYLVTSIILMLIRGNLETLITFSIMFVGVLFGNIFILPVNWNNNEERYNELKKNMK